MIPVITTQPPLPEVELHSTALDEDGISISIWLSPADGGTAIVTIPLRELLERAYLYGEDGRAAGRLIPLN